MNNQQKVANETLKSIMQICKDGEKGYKNAAENTKEGNLNTLFLRMSQQRATFYSELKREMELMFGEEYKPEGTLTGSIHRLWQDTKATFTGNSSEEVIEECIRGEKVAIKAYKQALDTNDMPQAIHDKLQEQYTVITSTLMQMELLEEAVD